jgi:hypothetical protein
VKESGPNLKIEKRLYDFFERNFWSGNGYPKLMNGLKIEGVRLELVNVVTKFVPSQSNVIR